jgi:hypothetical protein
MFCLSKLSALLKQGVIGRIMFPNDISHPNTLCICCISGQKAINVSGKLKTADNLTLK